jgi:hypothetical protein
MARAPSEQPADLRGERQPDCLHHQRADHRQLADGGVDAGLSRRAQRPDHQHVEPDGGDLEDAGQPARGCEAPEPDDQVASRPGRPGVPGRPLGGSELEQQPCHGLTEVLDQHVRHHRVETAGAGEGDDGGGLERHEQCQEADTGGGPRVNFVQEHPGEPGSPHPDGGGQEQAADEHGQEGRADQAAQVGDCHERPAAGHGPHQPGVGTQLGGVGEDREQGDDLEVHSRAVRPQAPGDDHAEREAGQGLHHEGGDVQHPGPGQPAHVRAGLVCPRLAQRAF